jgi:hypothetical protein
VRVPVGQAKSFRGLGAKTCHSRPTGLVVTAQAMDCAVHVVHSTYIIASYPAE